MSLVTEKNKNVAPAKALEFSPLVLGPKLVLKTPVVLAPMAGVTNAPYRRICRSFGEALYVSEMIAARGFAEGHRRTRQLAVFHEDEKTRSLQLYGTEPYWLEEAARILVGEHGVEHLDLNLGCPVRKLTSKGGGAAIPHRTGLLALLLEALKRGAGQVPITVKMRLGIDEQHLSYLEACKIAVSSGVAAIGLHARTAAQLYHGEADWSHIAIAQAQIPIPLLGNGDIWEAQDALRMMRETKCQGVIIGRACLGRPWLFGELEDLFAGKEARQAPNFGEIRAIALRHAALLVDFFGQRLGIVHMRKFSTWYTKSFQGGSALRNKLTRIENIDELTRLLAEIPAETPFPIEGLRVHRGKRGGRQKVSLPPGFFASELCSRGSHGLSRSR